MNSQGLFILLFVLMVLHAIVGGKPSFNLRNNMPLPDGVSADEAEEIGSVAKFAATAVSQFNYYGPVDIVRVIFKQKQITLSGYNYVQQIELRPFGRDNTFVCEVIVWDRPLLKERRLMKYDCRPVAL